MEKITGLKFKINLSRKSGVDPEVIRRNKITLINNKGKHNKYYIMKIFKSNEITPIYYVNIHYGRIGTNGREDNKPFITLTEANMWMDRKYKEQLGKGYVLA